MRGRCCVRDNPVCNINIGTGSATLCDNVIGSSSSELVLSNNGCLQKKIDSSSSSSDVVRGIRSEIQRLNDERDRLLFSGVYSEEDDIVRELQHQMDELRKSLCK
jgi:hypothetical protein